ncbi:MAG: LysE family transporter [Dehalococcoidales bacterium]|nr:LysE family transporter [Dehalococcoidales bacterium]
MLPILLSVVVISLSGVMQPGIMFAMTVAKSYKSPWAGPLIALGHAVIELPLILLIYFGFANFFQNTLVQLILNVLGGSMIIWMGISMFRARTEVTQAGKDLPYNALTAGIFTSLFNPFFLVWWATAGSMLVMKIHDFGMMGLALLTSVHWLCDLIWLSFVSILIYRTKSLWGSKFQQGLFITCSLLLIGFGGWFIISGLQVIKHLS